MSSVQENLIFTVKVQATGLTVAQVQAYGKAIKDLSLIKPTGNLGPFFNDLNSGLKSSKSSMDGFVASVTKSSGVVKEFIGTGKQAGASLTGLNSGLKTSKTGMDQLISSTNTLKAGLGGLSVPITQGANAMRQFVSSSSGAKASMDGLRGSVTSLAAGINPLSNAIKAAASAVTTSVSGMTNSFRTMLPTMTMYNAEGKKWW